MSLSYLRPCGGLGEGYLRKREQHYKQKKVSGLSKKITRSAVLLEYKIAHW